MMMKTENCTYEGLHVETLQLGLMCDALQELSEPSVDLQKRDMNL